MGIGSIIKLALRSGSKSVDNAAASTKTIGGTGSVTVSKVDPLDPAATYRKAVTSEPNMANILRYEAKSTPSVVSSGSKVANNLPTSAGGKSASNVSVPTVYKSVDDVAATNKAATNEAAADILKSAKKNTSVLGNLGKLVGIGSLGLLAGAALTGTSVLAGGGDDPQKQQNGELPTTVTGTTDENGNPTYIYQTGNEGVDDALGWLQDQIDEIVTFLSSLLGGSSGGSGGGGSLVLTDDATTGETGGKKKLLIIGLGLVIAAIAAYFLTRRKNGGTKKGGSKK